jgi:hypothetical protein
MNRLHEGKACDAVIRHLETRDGGTRHDLKSPESEGDTAPIELTCSIGGRLFAFEHTAIEPFEGQIKLETQALFQPLRDMFSGKIPQGEWYDLHVPVRVTVGLKKARMKRIISTLGAWISTEGPRLRLAPIGLTGTPVERTADTVVPFNVALYRCSLPGPGRLSVTHLVGPIDDLRTRRIQRACQQKFPKLAVWKTRGARTVLILEGVDDQVTNPIDVAKSVLFVEETVGNEPDEIYFLFSIIEPWSIWPIRIGSRSFFDLKKPKDRAWDVDPQTLSKITNR